MTIWTEDEALIFRELEQNTDTRITEDWKRLVTEDSINTVWEEY
jgi:hypothetical protein